MNKRNLGRDRRCFGGISEDNNICGREYLPRLNANVGVVSQSTGVNKINNGVF